MILRYAIIIFFLAFTSNTFAKEDMTINPAMKELLQDIKCLTCLGQNIYESRSEFANMIVHFTSIRMKEGKSTMEIKEELVSIYGLDVILTPGPNSVHFILWVIPALAFILLVLLIIRWSNLKRRI